MRYATVCAIAKDETKDLQEWASYHFAIGFEHIFMQCLLAFPGKDNRDALKLLDRELANPEITRAERDIWLRTLANYYAGQGSQSQKESVLKLINQTS